jgi:hypothetical protein
LLYLEEEREVMRKKMIIVRTRDGKEITEKERAERNTKLM